MKKAGLALGLLLGAATVASAPAPEKSAEPLPGAIVARTEGYPVPFPDGRLLRIKVGPQSTGSSELVMVVEDMPPGTAIPTHRHNRDEEILFVQRGTPTIILGEREAVVEAGASIYIPRGVWIGVRNSGSEPATVVAVFAHHDMDACFRLLAKEESGVISAEDRLEYNRACAWEVRQ